MNDVCSLELLTNAVANRLTADEETALYDHLERCEACCARMEQLAGGEQWQKEAASLLTTDELDAAVPEPTVWSEVDFSVEHLEPSEDANVLGQLGGYDVLAIIGRGGMGVVLKAFDRELKRFVAIKALSPHLAHSSVARKRFAREAQAAAAVVNPHVIAIHHVQPTGRLPFLIMPLLTGESLAQRLKSRAPLELTEVLRIGMQAAVGLAAAHDQGLVHRDVKPANIFLEKGVERVVITDFGLARAADDVSMTRLGVVAGTPEYMSPEQARGEALDSRSDLFSLGCVLYEMATGVSPFRSDSTIATLRRIVDDRPAAIASLAPELPPWFSYIVERLLSKDPAQRFTSASEVALLLEQCLSHLQQPASVALPASLVAHAKGHRSIFNSNKNGMLLMLGSLGMALLGMVLWQTTEPTDIRGQWTSDEWGTVVLEAKEPGVYEGTFTGFGQDKRTQSNSSLGGVDPATLGLRIIVPSMGPKPLGVDFLAVGPDGLGMSPKSAADPMGVDKGTAETDHFTGVTFRDLDTVDTTTGKVDSKFEGNFSGMSGFAFRGLDKNSGKLHLKWSRLERRFNGTWGEGAARKGTISLRLVEKEIRGAWTTDEDVQLESGTPLLGDLQWTRSVATATVPVPVSDGGTVLLGDSRSEAVPPTIPPGDIRVDVYAGRGVWNSPDKEIDKLLDSFKSLRGVTVQVHEDGTGDAFTYAIVHDPAPVRAEPAENQKREVQLRVDKIAIDEALRAHKVPRVSWLNASGIGQEGPEVVVPDGSAVLLGGQPTTNRAEATLPVPQPVLSNVTLAERSATVVGVGGDDLDCVLRIAKSKRNEQLEWTTSVNGHFSATVTAKTDRLPSDDGQLNRRIVLTIQDSKKSSTTSIGMSDGDPVPVGAVKFRQVSAMDRADTMMTFADIHCDDGTSIPISILLRSNKQHNKIAIDEAFRAHKVPNVRWLDASGNQLDGPIPTVPAQPPTPANTDDSALSVVDETLKSLIESLKPLQGDWAVELPGTQFYVVELPGTQFYPADKLGDSAVSHFVMRIRTNHVELRPFPHSGEQPVSKLLLHPIQDAKPGHFLVDTDPSAVDQRFSPGEFSFEVQDNQLHVKLIPAKSSESNRPDQGSEAPKGFSARRETEGFSARRATDEEQRKFAQDRLQHMRMVGYKNADRTNPEAVVEAYVAASLAGDVAIATSLAEGSAARPDQSTGWNKHWNLNDFAIKSVRVRGQVVTPMRVTAKEAIVVSELMHRTSPATIGDVSVGHHVTFLKNINGKWVVSAFDLWTAEHYNQGIGNFLNADGEAIGVP